MQYDTKYTSLQCWHIRKVFPTEVAEQIISGERDLSPDEIELRDQAMEAAETEDRESK